MKNKNDKSPNYYWSLMPSPTHKKFSFWCRSMIHLLIKDYQVNSINYWFQLWLQLTNNLGGHYFKSDSDIVKITLILDCNSPNIEGTIPNELQGKNKFQAIYSFNLAKLVSFNFAISVFKEEMNRILNLLFFSLRFNPKTIDKIISDLDELYVNYGIQNESNLQ